jgi:hypothetical protein
MNTIVNPKYRWLNSLLVAMHLLVTILQIFLALLGTAVAGHLLLGSLYAYLAFFLYRVTPWAYLAVALVQFVGILGILKNLAELGIYGFIGLVLATAVAWCAIFIRSNLLTVEKDASALP